MKISIFSLLFLFVLIHSTIRIIRNESKSILLIISILIEIPVIVLMALYFQSFSMAYLFIIMVDIFLFLKLKPAVPLGLITYIAVIISYGRISDYELKQYIGIVVANFVILVFFATASYLIRKEIKMKSEIQKLYNELKLSKDELQNANVKLKDYAEKVEAIAVLNERNRLAGEIHDTIGHSLTALIMELDICTKLIDKDKQKTKEELEKASELARKALAEVRRSVRDIMSSGSENTIGIKAMEELIRDFSKSTKILVELNVSEQRYKLSPTVEVTIYRAIQEALTNSTKYGQTDRIKISLSFKNGYVFLEIKDYGVGNPGFEKGIGLSTMEERVQALGGKINFRADGGFFITIEIPVEVRA